MTLTNILSSIKPLAIVGNADIEVKQLCLDSRKITEGSLFFAVKGSSMDGHQFISKAVASGACAIVCEQLPETIESNVTYVQVANTEHIVGVMASEFYGRPSEQLKLVGVTGTNGKTTIATLLYKMFLKLGYRAGLLSTVCNYVNDKPYPTDHTTPDPITLNSMLAEMVEAGCDYAFMEVSSHSVVQQRIAGLRFVGGIFTNLTRDHLDYHKTFEAYRDAKKGFFDILPKGAFAVVNADDKNGLFMVQNTAAEVFTYSLHSEANFKARILEESFEGMNLQIDGREVFMQFIGRFNVSNLLAVYGSAVALGQKIDEVLLTMSTLHPVNGRFEAIRSNNGVTAIVDYAHTPDALDNVLQTINEILKAPAQCITVCGAGGNRDKGKRPLMAQSAVRASDRVIITSDNPRFEEPQAIIDDMLAGLTPDDMQKVVAIVDRREAIRTACLMARPGDVILIAGKGHEDYQEICGVKHHFDDHEIVKEAFAL